MARTVKKREKRTQPQMDWGKIDKLIWTLVSNWDGSDEKKENILEGVKEQFMWSHKQAEVACQMHFNFWLRKNGLPEIPYENILKVEEELKQIRLAKEQADLPVKSTRKKKTTTKKKTTKPKTPAKNTKTNKKPPVVKKKPKTTTKKTTTRKKKTEATLDNFAS